MAKRTLRNPKIGESWLPAPGFEGFYEVSDHGQVRRLATSPGATVGYILKPYLDGEGYPRVSLHRRRARTQVAIHRLVAQAFIGPPAVGRECNHRDGDKTNNRVSNLEWVTGPENRDHAVRVGLTVAIRGEGNGQHKLTQEQVGEIRALRGKVLGRILAVRYGVTKSAISQIQLGQTWRS
jgi:hypothetical protein